MDYSHAIEAVAYELARHNAESPLDRGAALRRRVEELAPGGLAAAFVRLAAERGWRGEESGEESFARVALMTRAYADALAALATVARSGRRLLAMTRGDRRLAEAALQRFGGAFDELVGPAGLPHGPGVLVVSTSAETLARAHALGARAVRLNRAGPPSRRHDGEWRSLDELPRSLGMPESVAA
ncbi:hypothetical protein [Candidatus Solirubrobacter pratensis]|uniref:hypothetical protein n=1 Tax=Candidatus Solirubrobacter pratensis TaxID=1298857 RepID=UPI00041A2529|nr:hypothetical protein [Candidatus Solirubrobacter pratensis]